MRLPFRQTHAVGLLALLTISAMVVSSALLLWGLRVREIEHARVETVALAQMLMEQTEQNFENADLGLQGVQERMSNAYGNQLALDSLPVHLLLSNRLSGMHQSHAIFIVDAQGRVANHSRDFPAANTSVADHPYYKVFAQGRVESLFIDRPVRNPTDTHWTLHLARPLTGADGKFRGVVVALIDIGQLEALYGIVKLDYSRPMAIYLDDGTLVASLPHQENMIGERAPELSGESLPRKGEDVRVVQHVSGDGGRKMFALGRLPGYPLLLSVSDDGELSLASWRETAAPIVIGTLFLSIFIALASLFMIGKLRSRELMSSALRSANDLHQHTVDSVMDGIVAVDQSMAILLFNPAAERMFGRKASEVIGKPLDMLIPERQRAVHRNHVGRFSTTEAQTRSMAPQLNITGQRGDGSEFPIESTISRSMIGGKLQLTAVLRDITEKRRAEIDLSELTSQLRSLSASLQSVREQERTRISRELHDELGQQLTGLKLSLSWLGSRLKDGRVVTHEVVGDMRQMLDAAIASVRRISTELRPPALDDLGFAEAVSWQTQEFAKRSNLALTLNLPGAPYVAPNEVATALFRIVQESLTNIARHAQATRVKVDLVVQDGRLVLSIQDDGQGFSVKARQAGVGLVGMRERAISIGAGFKLFSNAGSGTTIVVDMPLNTPPGSGDET